MQSNINDLNFNAWTVSVWSSHDLYECSIHWNFLTSPNTRLKSMSSLLAMPIKQQSPKAEPLFLSSSSQCIPSSLEEYQLPQYWDVTFPDYEFTSMVAQTDSSLIWVGYERSSGEKVALKINEQCESETSESAHMERENAFMSNHKLTHMAKVKQVVISREYRLIVMEFYPWNLADILKHFTTNAQRRYSDEHISFVIYAFKSILEAVRELHQIGYVHRDLKPDNFLVSSEFHIVLSDFNLVTEQLKIDGSLSGTLEYMAPQRLSKKRSTDPIKTSVDIWSMGVILYELFTGETPFNGENPQQILEEIYEGMIRSKNIPPTAMSIISSMLQIKVEKRATLEQIEQHAFLQQKVQAYSLLGMLQQ